jgi:hypothetical protein
MDKPVKVMDCGKGLRSNFYGWIFFSLFFPPIVVVLFYWGLVAYTFFSGDIDLLID